MKILYNGKTRDTDDHTTIASLLEQLELDVRQVAVEINENVVPRANHADFVLHEGDRIEVVTLVGGG